MIRFVEVNKKEKNQFGFKVAREISKAFLPIDYQDTTAENYVTYQLFDSLQGLCSYLRQVLANRSFLSVIMGVDNTNEVSITMAALSFIYKDGCGLLSSLLFTYFYSNKFQKDMKFYRLFADLLNDLALSIELVSPVIFSIFGEKYFIACIVLANVSRSLCGVSAMASKTIITSHFAIKNNLADVAAKEGSQEVLVTLIGIMFGYFFVEFDYVLSLFIILTLLHLIFNYIGVRVLYLRTLNRNRLFLLIENYLKEKDLSLKTINRKENIFFNNFHDNILLGVKMDLGDEILQYKLHIKAVKNIEKNLQQNYLIVHHKGKILIYILDGFDENKDFINAMIDAIQLSVYKGIKIKNKQDFLDSIEANDWEINDSTMLDNKGFVYSGIV